MKHRKTGHIEKISDCVNNKNGWCRFIAKECWYKHSESSYEDESESQNPRMSRLFDMMEKFAERMDIVEKNL